MEMNKWSMAVDVETLERALRVTLDHVRSSKGGVVPISEDYYWDIQEPSQRYNVLQEPTELTIGQLSHDWERVAAIAAGENPPVGYGLVWIASLLRAMAESCVG